MMGATRSRVADMRTHHPPAELSSAGASAGGTATPAAAHPHVLSAQAQLLPSFLVCMARLQVQAQPCLPRLAAIAGGCSTGAAL